MIRMSRRAMVLGVLVCNAAWAGNARVSSIKKLAIVEIKGNTGVGAGESQKTKQAVNVSCKKALDSVYAEIAQQLSSAGMTVVESAALDQALHPADQANLPDFLKKVAAANDATAEAEWDRKREMEANAPAKQFYRMEGVYRGALGENRNNKESKKFFDTLDHLGADAYLTVEAKFNVSKNEPQMATADLTVLFYDANGKKFYTHGFNGETVVTTSRSQTYTAADVEKKLEEALAVAVKKMTSEIIQK